MAQKTTNVVPIKASTKATRAKTIDTGTPASPVYIVDPASNGGDGGNGDWRTSVETRLGELRSDVRNLLIGGAAVTLALAGAGWTAYTSTLDKLQALAVSQKEIQGKIDVLEVKLGSRFDILEVKLNDQSQASPRKR